MKTSYKIIIGLIFFMWTSSICEEVLTPHRVVSKSYNKYPVSLAKPVTSVSFVNGLGQVIEEKVVLNTSSSKESIVSGKYLDCLFRDSIIVKPFLDQTQASDAATFYPTNDYKLISAANNYWSEADGFAYSEIKYWPNGDIMAQGKPGSNYALSSFTGKYGKSWTLPVPVFDDIDKENTGFSTIFDKNGFLLSSYFNDSNIEKKLDSLGSIGNRLVKYGIIGEPLLPELYTIYGGTQYAFKNKSGDRFEVMDGDMLLFKKSDGYQIYEFDLDNGAWSQANLNQIFPVWLDFSELVAADVSFDLGLHQGTNVYPYINPNDETVPVEQKVTLLTLQISKDEDGNFSQTLINSDGNVVKTWVNPDLQSETDQSIVSTMEYNGLGQLETEKLPGDNGNIKSFYDSRGNVVKKEYPGGRTKHFWYDGAGNLQYEQSGSDQFEKGLVVYDYDNQGRLSLISTLIDFNSINGPVDALAVSSTGDLYAAGSFTNIHDASSSGGIYIARFDGQKWYPIGNKIDGTVKALLFDDSDNLYIGGEFSKVDDVLGTENIAMWDGESWSALGLGVDGAVNSLELFDGRIYVGGGFLNSINVENVPILTNYIAVWDGTWSALGEGVDNTVNSITAISNSEGSFIYAAKEKDVKRAVLTVDEPIWEDVIAIDYGEILCMKPGVIGGDFAYNQNGTECYSLITYDGLSPNGEITIPDGAIINSIVQGVAWYSDQSGATMSTYFAGDGFSGNIGGYRHSPFAHVPLTSPEVRGGAVNSLAMWGIGNLYAGGTFTSAGNVDNTAYLAKWDGVQWEPLIDRNDFTYLEPKVEYLYDTITVAKLDVILPTASFSTKFKESLSSELFGNSISSTRRTKGKLLAEVAYNENGKTVCTFYSYNSRGEIENNYKLIPGVPPQKWNFKYDIQGNVVETDYYNKFNDVSGWTKYYTKFFNYDSDLRLTSISLDSKDNVLVSYEYDYLKGLTAKKFKKKNGTADLEKITYEYDLLNKLKSISTTVPTSGKPFFKEVLYYEDAPAATDGFVTSGYKSLYNGNISGILYDGINTSSPPDAPFIYPLKLSYSYDNMNRLVGTVNGTTASTSTDKHDESFVYDEISRITTKNEMASTLSGYSYSNRGELTNISSSTTKRKYPIGCDEETETCYDCFIYDPAGNMVIDRSKNMVVRYDWRNLPYSYEFYNELPLVNKEGDELSWKDVDDLAGMIIEKTAPATPVSVTLIGKVEMVYDANGTRAQKLVYSAAIKE